MRQHFAEKHHVVVPLLSECVLWREAQLDTGLYTLRPTPNVVA